MSLTEWAVAGGLAIFFGVVVAALIEHAKFVAAQPYLARSRRARERMRSIGTRPTP
jgi:hypothetical protein